MFAIVLKSKRFCVAILLVPLLLGYVDGSAASSEPGRWQELPWVEGFESALRQAKNTGRPALVYFQARWCSWCHIYERDILGDPEVQRSIAQHYIPVLVNYDARPELFRRLGGFGLPYTVIVSPAGHPLARLPGILSVKDMTAALEEIATGKTWSVVQTDASWVRISRLDTSSYLGYRRAYLEHLDTIFEPETGTFTGYLGSGTAIKRPAPIAWLYLAQQDLWLQRSRDAARITMERLYDEVDGGLFYFRDPHRADEHLETSKLLDANIWLGYWLAFAGKRDNNPALIRAAIHTVEYLEQVLWDSREGGFYQAQIADPAYYSASRQERDHCAAPPIDHIKRTDTNAQAAWALAKIGDLLDNEHAYKLAADTLDSILLTNLHDNRLYHSHHDDTGYGIAFNLPHDLFWILAAAQEVQRVRFDDKRGQKLQAVKSLAGEWLNGTMRAGDARDLPTDLLGLIAWVTVLTHEPMWPAEATKWALRGVQIDPQTQPQDPVFALMAWEELLAARER
ncbi:MAG: thioredoxin family protein [Pseudomonadota bacterium]